MSTRFSPGVDELVMWNRLQAVADEQAEALMRTAFSPIVRESGDLSAGVFDVNGRMLAQAVTGTPGHVNTMAGAVANFFDHFPRQSMRPGDVYVTNDPWIGAGHLNDLVLVQPCFAGDTLVGFVSCTSHLVDIGGQCMGPDGSDVYDEGLYIPPIRLQQEGQLNETLIQVLKANSRIPDESEGDVHALLACCQVGVTRLRQMLEDFEIDDLESLSRSILSASERATRARIAALPGGVYENHLMSDGHDFEIELKAALHIQGDRLWLDLDGCSGPSRHGINVPLNYAKAYALFGIKCVVAPEIPNNAGALAPMDVIAPRVSIVNAQKPAPVCSRHIIGQLLPDLALGCLHQAVPGRVPAEGAATLWDLPMRNAVSSRNARPFSVELVHNGGTGARPAKDGLSATAYPSGVMGSMVEVTENVAPLRVKRREYRTDSGGPGRSRGGLGQVIEIESAEGNPLLLFGTVDRIKYPARGRESGEPGARGVLALSSGALLKGKGRQEIPGGQTLKVLTPGGGGFGPAIERDPIAVAEDVADGLVSRKAAARDYGVVIGDDGRPDLAASEDLRREMATRCVEKAPQTMVERFEFGASSRGSGRIGLVVPFSNTNLEPDMQILRPDGVSLHVMRVGGYDLDAIPDSDQMRKLALSSLDQVIESLKAALPDVILYGCTSATLALGPEFDLRLKDEIETLAGVPAVTAAGAVVEALADLGVRRIAFCSPYVQKLHQEAIGFLTDSGFEVVSEAHVETDLGNYGQGALAPKEVFELAMRADHPQAQALVLSCTDMRAVEAIPQLESVLNKPVVTSNQALMHAAKKRLRLNAPAGNCGGRLMQSTRASAPPEKGVLVPRPRPGIESLDPYPVGESGKGQGKVIVLSSNERAVAPSERVLAAYRNAAAEVHRYGDGSCVLLRESLARTHGLDPARIVCGNGSGELIALLAGAYCAAGDEVLMSEFAYLYFDTAARIADARPARVPGTGFEVDVDALLEAVTPRTRLLFLDNPNNPTGSVLERSALERLRAELRPDVLLVIDAAYAEYVTGEDYSAGEALVAAGENTVMLRTFSKIYGLAGARIGWACCPPRIADVLNRARLPNNVSVPAQTAAIAALAEQDRVEAFRQQNARLRRQFTEKVNALGLKAHKSQGSFVLVQCPQGAQAARDLYAGLKSRGILARPMDPYRLNDCIRVTMGSDDEMQQLLESLAGLC